MIDTQEVLDTMLAHAKDASYIAVDTEFLRRTTYYPKACLLQLGLLGEAYALDLLAELDFSGVFELFADAGKTFIFHAPEQDLEIIQRAFGVLPLRVFDTQLAEAYLTEDIQPSYAKLVQKYMGLELPKDETLCDWSLRPLKPCELEYALNDVRYLEEIARAQTRELARLGRTSWYEEDLRHMVKKVAQGADLELAYLKVKGQKGLRPHQRLVLQDLAMWRELQAQKKDRTRRSILSDSLLIQLAKRPPKNMAELARVQKSAELSKKYANAILRICKKPRPKGSFEPRKPQKGLPKDMLSLIEALVRSISKEEQIAKDLLATVHDVNEYFSKQRDTKLAKGWRKELVATQIDALVRGEIALTLHHHELKKVRISKV